MGNKILLDDKPYEFKENELPCLITYNEGMGGSHLTMTIVADLFLQGSKILTLTAYPMAKDNFLEQTGNDNSKIAFVNSMNDLEIAKNKQAIILESGNENLFLEVVKSLPDIKERVILIKNIEVFSNKTIENCLNLKKIILSGNIDECISKAEIVKQDWKTIIVFNQPNTSLSITVPELEKYNAFFLNSEINGIIKVQK